MKLRVLGSSGAEFPGHRPPAFLLDTTVLLDAGTIGAVLSAEEQWKVREILLTHAHLDHIRAIPFLADNIIVRNKKHHVRIMSIPPVLGALKKHLLNDTIWPDFTRIPSETAPVLRLQPLRAGVPVEVNGYKVTPHLVNHSVPATGYVVEDSRGRKLVYTGDSGPTDAIWKKTPGPIHCAIIEVSFPNRMRDMAVLTGHLTPYLMRLEIGKMRSQPDRVLITHPKPQYRERIIKEIEALGLPGITIMRDGESFTI
jgi:ribonuclease BN (tRNA processing enzyme)